MRSSDSENIQNNGSSEFNSAFATLERMHKEMTEANYYSGYNTMADMKGWWGALRSLERELWPYVGPEEGKSIDEVRVKSVKEDDRLFKFYFDKLDAYERVLRAIHASKGFGIRARDRMEDGMMD